ncbi:MAG: hypothetical protein QOC74_1139, partial [Pseudonocardiales bacterium]|nr:hypothetical protein [Pseudonocardiales bacterium]
PGAALLLEQLREVAAEIRVRLGTGADMLE